MLRIYFIVLILFFAGGASHLDTVRLHAGRPFSPHDTPALASQRGGQLHLRRRPPVLLGAPDGRPRWVRGEVRTVTFEEIRYYLP